MWRNFVEEWRNVEEFCWRMEKCGGILLKNGEILRNFVEKWRNLEEFCWRMEKCGGILLKNGEMWRNFVEEWRNLEEFCWIFIWMCTATRLISFFPFVFVFLPSHCLPSHFLPSLCSIPMFERSDSRDQPKWARESCRVARRIVWNECHWNWAGNLPSSSSAIAIWTKPSELCVLFFPPANFHS